MLKYNDFYLPSRRQEGGGESALYGRKPDPGSLLLQRQLDFDSACDSCSYITMLLWRRRKGRWPKRFESFAFVSTSSEGAPRSTYTVYLENHSVCPLIRIGNPHPLSRKRVCPPPTESMGEWIHSPADLGGWGSPNLDDWRKA